MKSRILINGYLQMFSGLIFVCSSPSTYLIIVNFFYVLWFEFRVSLRCTTTWLVCMRKAMLDQHSSPWSKLSTMLRMGLTLCLAQGYDIWLLQIILHLMLSTFRKVLLMHSRKLWYEIYCSFLILVIRFVLILQGLTGRKFSQNFPPSTMVQG